MIDRYDLYARWLSLALVIEGRACGKTQSLQPSIGGTKAPPMPDAGDLQERRELEGGMIRWLDRMGRDSDSTVEAMHGAITRATAADTGRLIGCIERAEWLVKVKWQDGRHRHLRASEADLYGREAHERTIIMRYRGVHTRDAAEDMQTTEGAVRWIRRKHGLTIKGERMYPCTVAPLDSCAVCAEVNTYSDDYESQEAA